MASCERGLDHPPGHQTAADILRKTECYDTVLLWIGQKLVHQDIAKVASALSIETPTPLTAGPIEDRNVYYRLLVSWQKKQSEATKSACVADLLSALSSLGHIPDLNEESVASRIRGIQTLEPVFENDPGRHSPSSSPWPLPSFRATFDDKLMMASTGTTQIPEVESNQVVKRCSELVIGGYSLYLQRGPYSEIKERALADLRKEIQEFESLFAKLLRLVFEMFVERKVSVESVKVYLNHRCTDVKGEIPEFSQLMIEIMQHMTMSETFMCLSRNRAWNFLSYFLLRDVLNEFVEDDHELKGKLQQYTESIESFKSKTLLLDFLDVWLGKSGESVDDDKKAVILRFIEDSSSYTIANACKDVGLLAGQFSVKQLSCFRLANGAEGSVYVMWLVSRAVANRILQVMKSKDKPDLLRLGILHLAVERTIFKFQYRYESLLELSINNPQMFWGGLGSKELKWRKKSREVFQYNKETGEFHWFRDAVLNVSENCLDVHIGKDGDKTALIWERDDQKTERVTFRKLLEITCQVANVLKKKGIKKGDVVIIYMPTMPLAVAAMLACARIGAIHCVVFSDFNERVLGERIRDVKAKAIITADARAIGGKVKHLQESVTNAINQSFSVEFVLMAKRSDSLKEVPEKIGKVPCFSLEKEMETVSSQCDPEPMNGEDILFIAYTSGVQRATSKGVFHTTAGFLLFNKLTFRFMFNTGPDDIMGCMSDLGWLGAHCFVVYGPLSNGCTTLLFESTATYPDEGRYWKTVDKLGLTHFYTVPSVLKELLLGKGAKEIDKYNLDSLKLLGTAGEPISAEVYNQYYSKIGKGKCLCLDTWGQTEAGGIGIMRWNAPDTMQRTDFPAAKSFLMLGVDLCLPDTTSTHGKRKGEFHLKLPLPGMGKKMVINGVVKTFEEVHYDTSKKCYSTGDLIEIDEVDGVKVTGRKDRALLIQGVWLSLTEIEEKLREVHAGTEICDAQVMSCEGDSPEDTESGGLCVILQLTSSIQQDKQKKYFSDTIDILTSYYHHVGSKIKIYFLKYLEGTTKYLRTATQKASFSTLKDYLLKQHSVSNANTHSWEVIDERKLLSFFQMSTHYIN